MILFNHVIFTTNTQAQNSPWNSRNMRLYEGVENIREKHSSMKYVVHVYVLLGLFILNRLIYIFRV